MCGSQDRELANDFRKHVMALFRISLHDSAEAPLFAQGSMAALGKEQLYYRHMLSGVCVCVCACVCVHVCVHMCA